MSRSGASSSPSPSAPSAASTRASADRLAGRHLRLGWWALFLFAALGLALELLHGFKAPFYLDVANETRRLMWRLAHAHGVLVALIHVVFGVSLHAVSAFGGPRRELIGTLLTAALILLPGGFFLGGAVVYGGDPGLGILLVPVGASALLGALAQAARGLPRS
jgi:hypothetical protein